MRISRSRVTTSRLTLWAVIASPMVMIMGSCWAMERDKDERRRRPTKSYGDCFGNRHLDGDT